MGNGISLRLTDITSVTKTNAFRSRQPWLPSVITWQALKTPDAQARSVPGDSEPWERDLGMGVC